MSATLLWFSGLETGDNKEFNQSQDGVVVTSPVRSGTYAIQFEPFVHSTAAVQVPGLSATMFVRFYIRPTALPNTQAQIYGSGSSTAKFRLYYNTDGTLTWDYNGTDFATSTHALTLNAWNLVEVKQVRDASVGGMEVYLNGVLEISDFTRNTTSGSSATNMRFFFGSQNGSFNSGDTTCYDDIAIGTGSYIGAGQCTKAQGKAGTPTYDAWTKNGAATAALAWSETPFSAGKNCSSSVLNDKQTMLTATLSAISAGSTINGAYVLAVAKNATGAQTVKIVRRVAGVDTISATRATIIGDTYVPNGINGETYDVFTDTLANLNASEIGVQSTSGSVVETVEDMWLMVDFVPAPPQTLTLSVPVPFETLGYLSTLIPIPIETLGEVLLKLALPAPIETLGYPTLRVPIPIETWIRLRSALPVPIETDGAPEGSLVVVFRVASEADESPLFVRFEVQDSAEEMGGLEVEFEVLPETDDALLVRFSAIPDGLVVRRKSRTTQAPVAKVVTS